MKLAKWFELPNLDGSRRLKGVFADKIGKSGGTITGYCDGSVWPDRETMLAIERETDGDVTALDFVHTQAAE